MQPKTVLVTGAPKRIGAEIARALHRAGMNVALHYRSSEKDADALGAELNSLRSNSAVTLQCDLLQTARLEDLVRKAGDRWGTLDAVVNNASAFQPSPVGHVTERQWEELVGSNMKAPFFIAQAAAPMLKASGGCIVNIVDIHAERPLKNHPVYSAAKAGLTALTRALAKELAPHVRVNAVSPGAIIWPENDPGEKQKKAIVSHILLKRTGCPADVAKAVLFLLNDADYITGEVIVVDGGRSLFS
ncbi:MAG: pteridine reductase [Pseudomonadota bacterium]